MNRTLILLAAAGLTAAGCTDRLSPLAPAERAVPDAPVESRPPAAATDAAILRDGIADALERILPAMEQYPSAAELRAALERLAGSHVAGNQALGAPLVQTRVLIEKLAREAGEAHDADLDAIRLALPAAATAEAR